MAQRFFHQLGASLLDRTICAAAGAAGSSTRIGAGLGMHVELFAESELILIWGATRSPRTCISGPARRRPSAAAQS